MNFVLLLLLLADVQSAEVKMKFIYHFSFAKLHQDES
jgi:hypothetical protein